MKKLLRLLSLLSCFLSVVCFIVLFCSLQDAPQDPLLSQQMSLSSAVRSALLNSRRSMTDLENSYKSMLDSLQNRVDAQSEELTTLSTHLTDTMNSFRASSAALESSNFQLELEKRRNAGLMKLLWTGAALFLINVAGKAVMFILWAKGINVPRWLDILI